jgi:ribonuclease P protein component
MRQTLRPGDRIRRRPEFLRAYAQGVKQHGRFMTVFVRRSDLPVGRLGVSATKKIGPAVVRNKAKRRARELFRRSRREPGVDLVVIPRQEFAVVSFERLEADFHAVVRRALAGKTPRRRADEGR